MSADQLRRAAKTLREHAEVATPGPWTTRSYGHRVTGEWTWEICGAPKGTAHTVVVQTSTDVPNQEIEAQHDVEYIVLMHPPVALALAEWLEYEARDAELDLGSIGGRELAVAVARAILRETGEPS